MRSTSAFLFVMLALCFLGLSQSSPRSKRTKTRGKERAHCQLTSDPGSCTSKLRRWFYDSTTEDCKTFIWTGCDGNDNRFRSRGQCERSCKGGVSVGGQSEDDGNLGKVKPTPVAKCRRLPCKGLRCHHGYEHGLDDNGCQTCQCRSLQMIATTTVPLVEPCPQVDCPEKFCPKGMQLDDRGCPTCQCLGCPPLNCPSHLNCRDGFVVNEQTGCERCECNIARDSERLHPVAAVTLPVTEKAIPASKDRELLQASEKPLSVSPEATNCPNPLQCFLQCSEGFAVDAAGCELCACLEDTRAAPHGDGLLCRPVECDISCADGYGTDENGCEICSCAGKDESEAKRKKKNCPKTTCAPQCELKVGKTGCPVCACKDDDVIECDSTALITCSMYCPGGYDRDSRGCEICECRPLADEKVPDVATEFVTCAPFNAVLCAELCEVFIIHHDENRCETCRCLGGQREFTTPVLRSVCPALLECTLECPEALERDERGCEICMCRQPEVDERLRETGNAGPEVKQDACPAIECPLPWCRMVSDQECPRCHCDGPGAVDDTQTGATCPEVECIDRCPDGYRVDDETGCPSCACVDDRQLGSVVVVTSDPFATRDTEFVYEAEAESQEPNPTPHVAWTDAAMPEAPPTTLAAPVTNIADPEGYPAEVMCSGRSCNKKCINGLRRGESEECFICECNPESRSPKRLVDVSVFNARKGICSLPAYKGPCHATLTRWNFNQETGTCETFEYGGCRGYANNFRSKESCVEFCVPEVNQDRAKRQERFNEVLGF